MRERGYWTYEKVLEEAKKYKTKKEFKEKGGRAYVLANKNKWMSEFTWIKSKFKPRNYWNHDTVTEAAKKYTTKKEFMENDSSAYSLACKNKWIDEFTWLQDDRINLSTDRIDSVYAYEFKDYNSVYVGRTLMRTQTSRNWQHIFLETDSVHIFACEKDLAIPDMKILEDNLTLEEGKSKEGYWVEDYRARGWNILNRAKTGSIGSLGKGKWNYEATKEESKKYTTRGEFEKKSPSAYHAARKNKWLDNFTWLIACDKGKRIWTEDSARQEALKYKTKADFRKYSGGAHAAAQKSGWIKGYDWFVSGHDVRADRDRVWTYEKTKQEAQKYTGRSKFCKGNGSAYSAALKNKWLDEFFPKQK